MTRPTTEEELRCCIRIVVKEGQAVVEKYGRQHMVRIGLLGAQALLDQHGAEHMAEIGRTGYSKAMQRYGVERPQPPILLNLRRVESPSAPTETQAPLQVFDDLDQAA